jgi:hypothetical protein
MYHRFEDSIRDLRPGVARRKAFNVAIRDLICIAAGPCAQRRYTGKPGVWESDWPLMEHAEEFLKRYKRPYRDHWDYANEAEARGEAFISEPEVWQQITAVADVLTRDGIIHGAHPVLRGIKRSKKLPDIGDRCLRGGAAA